MADADVKPNPVPFPGFLRTVDLGGEHGVCRIWFATKEDGDRWTAAYFAQLKETE